MLQGGLQGALQPRPAAADMGGRRRRQAATAAAAPQRCTVLLQRAGAHWGAPGAAGGHPGIGRRAHARQGANWHCTSSSLRAFLAASLARLTIVRCGGRGAGNRCPRSSQGAGVMLRCLGAQQTPCPLAHPPLSAAALSTPPVPARLVPSFQAPSPAQHRLGRLNEGAGKLAPERRDRAPTPASTQPSQVRGAFDAPREPPGARGRV